MKEESIAKRDKTWKETVRNRGLARKMKEYCPDYTLNEYEDMTRIFKEVIEQIVFEGGRVSLENFGTFQQKVVKGKYAKHFVTKEWVYWPTTARLKFTPSGRLEARWRIMRKQKETKNETSVEQS